MPELDVFKVRVEVLDPDICSKCRMMDISNYPVELYGGDGMVIGMENHFLCKRKRQCKYLRDLFASKATPKVEEAKVP